MEGNTRRQLRVSVTPVRDVDSDFVRRWKLLEQRADPPNAYLSPSFVLPAARYLTPSRDIFVAWAEEAEPRSTDGADSTNGADIVALVVYSKVKPSRYVPVPHIALFQTKHTFANGLLLDRCHEPTTVRTLLNTIVAEHPGLGFIEAQMVPGECIQHLTQRNLDSRCVTWTEYACFERPVLKPSVSGEGYLREYLSSNRRKNIRAKWKKLARHGRLEWQLLWGQGDMTEHIETFLRLEHKGWKGTQGTSLLSSCVESDFFREIMFNFACDGKALFSELCLNGAVLASISNMVSGDRGFAFKVGSDPEYAEFSPGILNEVEMIRQAPNILKDLSLFDSGASPGSYIYDLWAERYSVMSGVVTTGNVSTIAVKSLQKLRAIKQRATRLLSSRS